MQVPIPLTLESGDAFSRILKGNIYNEEVVLKDSPVDFNNGFEYIGIATNAATIDNAVWSITRWSWINNRVVEIRFRNNIKWSERSLGW